MRMELNTKYGRFTAVMEPNDDREGMNCYVFKDNASSSLACAMDQGTLERMNGTTVQCPEEVSNAIYEWAIDRGY